MREEYDFSNAKRGVVYGKIEKRKVLNPNEIGSKTLAVCLKTFDAKSLIARKIYDVTFLANGLVSVIDEEGEIEIYPSEYFLAISLPAEAEDLLAQIAA